MKHQLLSALSVFRGEIMDIFRNWNFRITFDEGCRGVGDLNIFLDSDNGTITSRCLRKIVDEDLATFEADDEWNIRNLELRARCLELLAQLYRRRQRRLWKKYDDKMRSASQVVMIETFSHEYGEGRR